MSEIAIGLLAMAGSSLIMLAGIGVVRFPDLYARMHAATKATTMGIALIAIASSLALDGVAGKIALAVALILVTSPSSAHLMGRAAYRVEGVDLQIDGPDDLATLMDEPED